MTGASVISLAAGAVLLFTGRTAADTVAESSPLPTPNPSAAPTVVPSYTPTADLTTVPALSSLITSTASPTAHPVAVITVSPTPNPTGKTAPAPPSLTKLVNAMNAFKKSDSDDVDPDVFHVDPFDSEDLKESLEGSSDNESLDDESLDNESSDGEVDYSRGPTDDEDFNRRLDELSYVNLKDESIESCSKIADIQYDLEIEDDVMPEVVSNCSTWKDFHGVPCEGNFICKSRCDNYMTYEWDVKTEKFTGSLDMVGCNKDPLCVVAAHVRIPSEVANREEYLKERFFSSSKLKSMIDIGGYDGDLSRPNNPKCEAKSAPYSRNCFCNSSEEGLGGVGMWDPKKKACHCDDDLMEVSERVYEGARSECSDDYSVNFRAVVPGMLQRGECRDLFNGQSEQLSCELSGTTIRVYTKPGCRGDLTSVHQPDNSCVTAKKVLPVGGITESQAVMWASDDEPKNCVGFANKVGSTEGSKGSKGSNSSEKGLKSSSDDESPAAPLASPVLAAASTLLATALLAMAF